MLASRLTRRTKLVNSNVDKYVDVACIFLSLNERYIMALIPPIYLRLRIPWSLFFHDNVYRSCITANLRGISISQGVKMLSWPLSLLIVAID